MLPSRVMATRIASSLSALGMSSGFETLAMSTETPFDSKGVTTMKIISSTSMMSAIGMTFGEAITGGALGLNGMTLLLSAPARDEVVDQLHRGVIHLHVESLHL